MEPSDTCYVNTNLYPHLFLIPSAIIICVLAFLNKRRSFKKDVWGGRPGLVIPLDFLGIDHNRLSVAAIFVVSARAILEVVMKVFGQTSESKWIQALLTIGSALEVAMLFYPFFACLTTEHKLIGSIMGLLYTFIWCVLEWLSNFDKCAVPEQYSTMKILEVIPSIICYLFIWGRFCTVILSEARRRIWWTGQHEHDLENATSRVDFTKPWLFNHVRNVLKPRPVVPENRCIRFLRLLYSPKANFQFSTLTVSIVVVCCICLYMFTVDLITFAYKLMESELKAKLDSIFANQLSCNINSIYTLGSCLLVSASLVGTMSVFSIVRFMECHKNNMLRMFKGDTSLIPKGMKRSQLMVGKCLKYAGYQIAFLVWGYLLLLFVLMIFSFPLAVIFHCDLEKYMFKPIFDKLLPYLCITVSLWLILLVTSMTIFRERSFKKDVIAVNNRNVYLVFSYFFFFLGLPVGLLTAVIRVLKALPLSFIMLPRVDICVMLDGFQKFDNGFAAYICYLHVQAAHRNPVLRVFCQVVYDAMRMTRDPAYCTLSTTKKYRNKWFLLVTLIRNPQLQRYRKHMTARSVLGYVSNETHVSVETPLVI